MFVDVRMKLSICMVFADLAPIRATNRVIFWSSKITADLGNVTQAVPTFKGIKIALKIGNMVVRVQIA